MLQRHYQESEMTTYRMRGVFANHLSDKGLGIRIYKERIIKTQKFKNK